MKARAFAVVAALVVALAAGDARAQVFKNPLGNTPSTLIGTAPNVISTAAVAGAQSVFNISYKPSGIAYHLFETWVDSPSPTSGNALLAYSKNDGTTSLGAIGFASNNVTLTAPDGSTVLQLFNNAAGGLVANTAIKSSSGGFVFPDNTTQTTAATAGLPSAAIFLSTAQAAKDAAIAGTSGSYTQGCRYLHTASIHVQGVKWYQPAGMTAAVTVDMWEGGANTNVATVAVPTPTAGALNTVNFSSPVARTAVQGIQGFWITVYDGTHQIAYWGAGNPNTPWFAAGGGTTRLTAGINMILHQCGYATGHSGAMSDAGSNYGNIDPLYTVP